jgi:multiple sugar transport system ATP-binding protein
MVFQDYALYPHMSVFDNLAFGLRLRRNPKATIASQVRDVAATLGIGELLARRPSELSGGQRQRVALGRAIIRNPVAFLMDEPLSNLDAALRVRTRTEIKKLQRDLGVTTVFVTHDQEEAMVLSDRIAVMRSGVLQQYGSPRDVYYNPANLYVASFMGSPAMNFLDGSLTPDQGELTFAFGEYAYRFPRAALRVADSAAQPRAGVTLGVRPEDVEVAPQPSAGDLPAEVFLVEPVGPVTYVDLAVNGTTLKASTSPDLPLQAGDRVGVRLRPNKVYFFERQSGARL